MRRSDREIKEFEEIIAVMEKCDVCRVAFNGNDGYPYMIPLNYGMTVENHKVKLFFHGAIEGLKYDLMKKDDRVCFEMDCSHRLVTDDVKMSCTMEYESVIGYGKIKILSDEEKMNALKILMEHYHKEDFMFNEKVVPMTNVFMLTVNKMTGKRRMVK